MSELNFAIITPTYNRENTIARCIKSVSKQNHNNIFKHIIIDDGSTDNTASVVKNYSVNDPNILYLKLPVNKGVNVARNTGILHSKSDFIIFLDSDDYLEDDALNNIKETIENNISINHFLFLISNPQNNFGKGGCKLSSYEDWLTGEISGDFTHVVRSEIMKNHLFFEEFRAHESLNWLRIFKISSPLLYMPTVTTIVDLGRNDSLTSSLKLNKLDAIKDKFKYLKTFLHLYADDLGKISLERLKSIVFETFCLGIAVSEKTYLKSQLDFTVMKENKLLYKLLLLCPAFIMRCFIISYSNIKSIIK